MDTQGMSVPGSGSDVVENVKPYEPKKIPAFTEQEREELKDIMREVLNEYIMVAEKTFV